MKADPNVQLKLLELQAVDSEVDQLRHRLGHLAEESVIKELTAERSDVLGRLRDQQILVDDLIEAQRKADADVEQVKARRQRDRDRMDAGLIANPKDLERMQHELETLERRISVLEDEELEVMEQLEEAQTRLTALQQQVVEIDEKLRVVLESRDKQTSEINAELTAVAARRDPIAAELPDDLLALYERLRASKNGTGAAALRARQCGGCMLTLDPAELARVRALPEDEVVRCEECQRILVRTPESGL